MKRVNSGILRAQKIGQLLNVRALGVFIGLQTGPGQFMGMLASPFGPLMGITKFAFPEELTSEIFPFTITPSVIGEPRAAMTAGLEFARATAPE
jgi:hypothetical protein